MMGRLMFKRSSDFLHLVVFLVILMAGGAGYRMSDAATPLKVIDRDVQDFSVSLSSSEAVDGSIVLVNIHAPDKTAPADIMVTFEKTLYPVYPIGGQSFRAVMAVPFNLKPGNYNVEVTLGKTIEAQTLSIPIQIKDGNYKSEVLKVAPKFTNPRKKDLIRIKKDQLEVGEIYRKITPIKYWDGPFVLPVDSIETSPFGTKRVFNGEMKSFHQGLDLRAQTGVKIFSAAPGVVVLARDLFFTGNTVLIDHGYGIYTLYAHLSKLDVKKGDKVSSRQQLGLSGATGRASGAHLHWGAVVHRSKVNPMDLIRVLK
jgi:murein DD-endopeptidase MepM/ murein hydrolase activator NlpD